MPSDTLERATAVIAGLRLTAPLGRVTALAGVSVWVDGLPASVRLGDRATVMTADGPVAGDVIRLDRGAVCLLADQPDGIATGDWVRCDPLPVFAPDPSWIGRVIDPDGQPLDGRSLLPGLDARPVRAAPPPAYARRPLGARVDTGLAVFNTLLPLARGQRIGLFAGSGVGKSTLLADLAKGVDADVIVIGLVGERGRELRAFVDEVLGQTGMARSVVVAATSDRAPQVRRRCAWAATAVAEYFRDGGQHVLLLIDSVTRFAEAHRELSVTAGEPTALRGFPATTGPAIAALCERAGPGVDATGDITAIYSVLVAGSDMDEPVADMLRGVLDGHVVLDRAIAEGGRFPAVDVLRSVSRSLPGVANTGENDLIGRARGLLATYDKAALMVQAGLYVAGSDPRIDAAIAVQPALEQFLALRDPKGCGSSFLALRLALAADRGMPRVPGKG